MRVVLSELAASDLESIGDRISQRDPARALSFITELQGRCLQIAEFPHAGPPRPQWGDGVRIVVHRSYLVVYRVREDNVQVLRVIHGARDLDALFLAEPLEP
jgi:toxin ParE1/3/4